MTAAVLWAATASAEVFRLGSWEGALEGVGSGSRQKSTSGGATTQSYRSWLVEERLTLRNSGAYFFDPGLATLTLGGSFGLSQMWEKSDGASDARRGTLLGYQVSLGLLQASPYALTLFADRDDTVSEQPLNGQVNLTRETRGATLVLRNLPVPSSLFFRQEIQQEESRGLGFVARRDETRNIVSYEGARGWENAEGSLRYEFTDLADRVLPGLDYQSHEASAYYSLDFGPELNRRWDSRVRFFTRTGASELTTATVDEMLRIDHTDWLQSNYRYALQYVETPGGATTTHTGSVGLRHRLYESLTTDARLETIRSSQPNGQIATYRGRADTTYRKRLPGDGLLSIGAGAGLAYDDNQFRQSEGFVPQEALFAATPFALPIALVNPNVVATSIVVTKTAFGPQPAGCIAPPGPPTPLVLGRDYTVRTVGQTTEIVPIACAGATPGINPGDSLAVEYRFTLSPSLAYTTASWRGDVSLDYGWVRPYLLYEQTDQRRISGQDSSLLDDQRTATAGVELRRVGPRLYASMVGEVRRFDSDRVAYEGLRLNQLLSYSILPELVLVLTGEQSWTDYSLPSRRTQSYGGRATLTYALDGNLLAELYGAIRKLKDDVVPDERIVEGGFRLRWMIRKIELSPSLEYYDRVRGDVETQDLRVMLRIVRRF